MYLNFFFFYIYKQVKTKEDLGKRIFFFTFLIKNEDVFVSKYLRIYNPFKVPKIKKQLILYFLFVMKTLYPTADKNIGQTS